MRRATRARGHVPDRPFQKSLPVVREGALGAQAHPVAEQHPADGQARQPAAKAGAEHAAPLRRPALLGVRGTLVLCPPWRPFRWAPREPRRLWAPREPRRLVIGADSKRKRLLHGGRILCRRCSAGGGGGLASPETHHPPHPSLAQILQQCIPRAPSLDFRSGLRASEH